MNKIKEQEYYSVFLTFQVCYHDSKVRNRFRFRFIAIFKTSQKVSCVFSHTFYPVRLSDNFAKLGTNFKKDNDFITKPVYNF